jgi:5S rRNA maturation endonuclease (ribonuclease M5)
MAQLSFNKNIIVNTLSRLGIDYDENSVNNNWMLLRCPLHNDKTMSNAGINLSSGVISCFSCKQTISLVKLFCQKRNCTYTDAIQDIFNTTSPIIIAPKIQTHIPEKEYVNYFLDDFITIELKPDAFYYTKQRGFTDSFCKKFQIKHCISGIYNDYFLIPIINSKKEIITFEARKLKQRELLLKYYLNIDFEQLQMSPEEYFKTDKNNNKWKIKDDFIIDKNKKKIYSFLLYYLLRSKVLYPSNSNIQNTVWNIDNLKFTDDVWVCEGIGTIPKLYQYISENCTSVFGSKLSIEQVSILKKFKNVIVISDNDDASFQMISYLNSYIDNLFVSECELDDTDNQFVDCVKYSKVISASNYILKKSFKKT